MLVYLKTGKNNSCFFHLFVLILSMNMHSLLARLVTMLTKAKSLYPNDLKNEILKKVERKKVQIYFPKML